MIGNTVSLILLMFTVTIAYVLAADQEDTRLYDQPGNYTFIFVQIMALLNQEEFSQLRISID